jgi:hypothetical protein
MDRFLLRIGIPTAWPHFGCRGACLLHIVLTDDETARKGMVDAILPLR